MNIGLNNTEEVILLDTDNCRAGCTIEHVSPIPLTEDILLKCGFAIRSKYANGRVDASLGRVHIYAGDDYYEVEYGAMYNFVGLCRIKHLHQLQNLIFVLSGKELEVKL